MTTPSPLLVRALRAVAANCDGAQTQDGMGFNGTDSVFGKTLALTPPEAWSPEVSRQAWEILRKYKGQIADAGIDYDEIPEPEGVSASRSIRVVDFEDGVFVLRFSYDPNLVASVKSIKGARWRPPTKTWSVPVKSKEFLLGWVVREGFTMTQAAIEADPEAEYENTVTVGGSISIANDRLAIVFDYDPSLVEEVKKIHGRQWSMEQRYWSAPKTSIREVRSFAFAHNLTLSPEVEALPDVDPVSSPTVDVVGDKFSLTFDYNPDLIAQVRDLSGAKWSSRHHAWLVDIEAAVEVAMLMETTKAVAAPAAVRELEGAREALSMIDQSKAHDVELEIEGLGGTLMPFQRAGIAYAMKARRTFIADEQGLGKTVQGLGTLLATDSFPALIVCPSGLKLNWERETKKWLPSKTVEILSGTNGAPRFEWSDITIINYDILHGWVKALPDLKGLVIDESHYAKNATARRSKALIETADLIDPEGVILCLTGTPVLNQPSEIMSQLRILKRLEDFGGAKGFRQRYGQNKNLTELNRRLRSTCFVRRLKIDVLPELPPKRWVDIAVEGDAKVMLEYREAENNLIKYLSERARKIALDSGATDAAAQHAAWVAGLKAEAAEHLVAVTALKRLAARAKMPSATAWVEDFVETGKKLVTFAWHRDIVDEVADRFGGGFKIQGGQSNEVREDAKDRFQTEELPKVLSCQIKAAGVGLTLTAASDVAFFELGWNPADMEQAADRCHRIGQGDSVTAWQFLTVGTIDETIAQLIENKRGVVGAVTDGEKDESEKSDVLGDLIVALTEKGLKTM